MGGRIAVALTALSYAKATERQLVVDWNDFTYYSPEVPDVFSALWDWPEAARVDLDCLAGLQVYPADWSDKLSDYRNDIDAEIMPYALSFFGPPDEAGPDVAKTAAAAEVVVITRNGRHERIADLYRNLRPSRFIRSRIALLAERYDWNRMIGVQIRHGNGEPYLTPANTTWFHERIGELRTVDPNLRVFLATDSIQVLNEFRLRYPGVVHTPKWYPPAGSGSMHHHPDCPSRFEHGVSAIIDTWLLKECSHLLMCGGFFGRTVEMLSPADQGHRQIYPGKIHATVEEKKEWSNPI